MLTSMAAAFAAFQSSVPGPQPDLGSSADPASGCVARRQRARLPAGLARSGFEPRRNWRDARLLRFPDGRLSTSPNPARHDVAPGLPVEPEPHGGSRRLGRRGGGGGASGSVSIPTTPPRRIWRCTSWPFSSWSASTDSSAAHPRRRAPPTHGRHGVGGRSVGGQGRRVRSSGAPRRPVRWPRPCRANVLRPALPSADDTHDRAISLAHIFTPTDSLVVPVLNEEAVRPVPSFEDGTPDPTLAVRVFLHVPIAERSGEDGSGMARRGSAGCRSARSSQLAERCDSASEVEPGQRMDDQAAGSIRPPQSSSLDHLTPSLYPGGVFRRLDTSSAALGDRSCDFVLGM